MTLDEKRSAVDHAVRQMMDRLDIPAVGLHFTTIQDGELHSTGVIARALFESDQDSFDVAANTAKATLHNWINNCPRELAAGVITAIKDPRTNPRQIHCFVETLFEGLRIAGIDVGIIGVVQ